MNASLGGTESGQFGASEDQLVCFGEEKTGEAWYQSSQIFKAQGYFMWPQNLELWVEIIRI